MQHSHSQSQPTKSGLLGLQFPVITLITDLESK